MKLFKKKNKSENILNEDLNKLSDSRYKKLENGDFFKFLTLKQSRSFFFMEIMDKLFYLLAVIPVIIFILWPITALFMKSIFPEGSFTLELYVGLFKENVPIIVNSIWVCILSTVLAVIIGTVIAVYTSYTSKLKKRLITLLLMLTMISPPFLSSLSYILLFGKRGFITADLLHLNVNPYGWHGIVVMQTFSEISLAALILIGGLTTIPFSIIEAGKDLGSKSGDVLWKIILPMLKTSIVAVFFIVFVKNIADFGTPIIVGGNFKMIATEAYKGVISYGEIDKAAAISFFIFLPIVFIFLIYRHELVNSNVMGNFSEKLDQTKEKVYELPKYLKIIFGLITLLFAVYMLIQYTSIFVSAVTSNRGNRFHWTLEYVKAFSFTKIPSLVRSVVYSLIAGFVSSFLGVLFSYYIDRRKIRFSRSFGFIAALPYILPGPFFGIAYILAFNNPPLLLTGTGAIVVLNCIFRQMPVTTKAASANLYQISSLTEDAARDLGTPKIPVFFRVILPQLKPAFLVGFINTFTATMTTVGAIIFLITPSAKVATVELFNVIRDGDYRMASVIASLLILVILAVNILFSILVLREKKVK